MIAGSDQNDFARFARNGAIGSRSSHGENLFTADSISGVQLEVMCMLRTYRAGQVPAMLVLAIILSGCAGKLPWKQNAQPATPPPGPTCATPPARPPYSMEAYANGPCISFSIVNHGSEELTISPYHFALIPVGSRQVIPYSPETAAVDVPASVKPGKVVGGRAVFREHPTPARSKLVFKPPQGPIFAVIGNLSPVPSGHGRSG